ncbi:MAG: hypothetical protein H0U75_13200 [Legionella sp.]|nr:hypothetical protein [Legionella sp.]
MIFKKIAIPAVFAILFTAFAGANAEAPCSAGSMDACWQMCKIDGIDHMVCARSVTDRMDACKKRNGQIQPATSRCGWGFNCNGCED